MYFASLCFFSFSILLIDGGFSIPTTTSNSIFLRTTDSTALITVPKSRYERGIEDYDEASNGQEKGMMFETPYEDNHEEHQKETKAIQGDPWAGYYDFLINEGSFKFWAVFQLVTALILVYASFAAVYYAKFNVIAPDYTDDYDLGIGRSNVQPSTSLLWSGLSAQTFQTVLDSISSKKYT